MRTNRRHVQVLGAIVIAVSTLMLLLPGATAHAVGNPSQEQTKHAQMIADIFDEHNKRRTQNGLSRLIFSPDISLRVSQPFTNELANKDNGTIWHNSHANIGKGGSSWAENVAGGFRQESASALVDRWMKSPGHRDNILTGKYNTIAIGFAWADNGNWTFSTVNLYTRPTNPGKTFATGAEWLASLNGSADDSVNVYLTPGTHNVNGRHWRTVCEPYSQTKRCRTEIWASQTTLTNGTWVTTNDWVFNNLTYAPSDRAIWADNPLGGNGVEGGKVSWTEGGRKWRTECDTALTGRGGCRTFTTATVVDQVGSGYRMVEKEIFNNMVTFS